MRHNDIQEQSQKKMTCASMLEIIYYMMFFNITFLRASITMNQHEPTNPVDLSRLHLSGCHARSFRFQDF